MGKENCTQSVKNGVGQLVTATAIQDIDAAIETLHATARKLESSNDPAIKSALMTLERCTARLEQHYVNNDEAKAKIDFYLTAEKGVGIRVRRLREEFGFTQSVLADMAGTNQAVIQKIENGHSTRPRVLSTIAVALDVNPAWLQYGDGFAKKATPTH